jgi:acetyl esterase
VSIKSEPDGNHINIQIIRPETKETLPCVYYIHGGGMCSFSCFDGTYRAWGKLLAAKGFVVVMVDFRNSATPSSVPKVAPFPAGRRRPQRLCLRWAHTNAAAHGIGSIIVAGETAAETWR